MKPLELLQAQHKVMHYFMILPRNRTGTYPTEFCPHFSLKQRERKWFNQTLVCPKPITAPENELLSASPLQAERRNLVILIEAWSPRLWWPQKRGFSRKKTPSSEKALERNSTQTASRSQKERKHGLRKREHRLPDCKVEMFWLVGIRAGGGVSTCSLQC